MPVSLMTLSIMTFSIMAVSISTFSKMKNSKKALFFYQVNWGMWGLPKVVCDFYIASDVICSTSSIFNLVAVSIDR